MRAGLYYDMNVCGLLKCEWAVYSVAFGRMRCLGIYLTVFHLLLNIVEDWAIGDMGLLNALLCQIRLFNIQGSLSEKPFVK